MWWPGLAAEPWQRAEVPGTERANVIRKPEVLLALLKKAKRPVLVVGHEALELELGEGTSFLDLLAELAKAAGLPVVATAHVRKALVEKGLEPAAVMSALDIGQRLVDPGWEGLDGKGQYDLVLVAGLPYYMEWVLLASLKDFAPHLKAVSLDPYYQPHASWSFPNTRPEEHAKNLKALIDRLGGR
ncbi:CO dehydrogenase/acetyl-CoA synthase complex subunit epsilon [Candidatus Bathyarchaeota archaeon]|nr:MAG: CO dehydrogenase/acetyl-CoA synthase complex subunit epsilon [Candidatus Bathyarchaeota archaeon]